MNLKKISLIALSLLFVTTTLHAATIISGSNLSNEDLCKNIAGDWKGYGHVTAFKILPCDYTGKANITSKDNEFQLQVALTLVKGACPAGTTELHFSGKCENSKIIINTDSANLNGSLVDSKPLSADLTGSVKISGGEVSVDQMHLDQVNPPV